jgi:hypothetical protein
MKDLFFGVGILSISLALGGCAHKVTLKPDNEWHTVWSANRVDIDETLDVEKKSNCDTPADQQQAEIRIIRLTHFMDVNNIPDTLSASTAFYSTTEHSGVPIRLLDSGPMDISQSGSTYQVKLTKGMALISRTTEDCSYLVIDRLTKKGE